MGLSQRNAQIFQSAETQTLYIALDSSANQYRNKNNVFLTKKCDVDNLNDIYWIFTESGHGKGPMDGVGSGIKKTIKDTISYNPDAIIGNTDQLLRYLPEMENVIIATYKEIDVKQISSLLPSPEKLNIVSQGFGISKVHEICFSKTDNQSIQWKKTVSG